MSTYLTDSEGKFIPASQRPDGTWRKARRVRDGYVPQEEVPLYESKGKQFAKKPLLPPGFTPVVKPEEKKKHKKAKTNQTIPGVIILSPSSQIGKNQQPQQTSSSSSNNELKSSKILSNKPIPKAYKNLSSITTETIKTSDNTSVDKICENVNNLEFDEKQELAKKLKKLKKKIREIETIEAKLKSGELKKPEKDQLDKIRRKKEILKEIEELEN